MTISNVVVESLCSCFGAILEQRLTYPSVAGGSAEEEGMDVEEMEAKLTPREQSILTQPSLEQNGVQATDSSLVVPSPSLPSLSV